MRPDNPRDPVAGPNAGPEAPFPIRLSGPVIKGYGRGSKDVCTGRRSPAVYLESLYPDYVTAARHPHSQHPRRRSVREIPRPQNRRILWRGGTGPQKVFT